ncbi:4Fe-4S dicluster domain-containing protein [Candidatus Parcubacteria bacterium]|nr:MAG: 4Fe-4S dicluster domain-containing protein [Candidatus Parcubacteria bacterium]
MKIKITAQPGSAAQNKTGGWRTFIPRTNLEICIGCGTCERVCPENAVAMYHTAQGIKPRTDYDYCKGCGLCASECPVKAIKMELDKK